MNELARRVLTAVIALPILIFAAWWSQPWLFYVIAFVAILAAVYELFKISELAGVRPFRAVGFAAAAAALGVAAAGRVDLHGAVVVVMTVALMLSMLTRVADMSRALVSAGATALSVLYVAVLGSYIVAVRAIGEPRMAFKLLLLFFVTIMANDIGAYFTGRTLGRRKLAPRVSPGKSVEGFVGGLVAGVAGALAWKYAAFAELPAVHAAILALVMGVLGPLGDLCESLLKRGSKVKDAASILPGHGGFLDRLDSMLLNAPVLYYYYALVLERRL
jgi:phosphatidate cytidylyltransferase